MNIDVAFSKMFFPTIFLRSSHDFFYVEIQKQIPSSLTTRRFFLKQIFWMQNFGIFREFSEEFFLLENAGKKVHPKKGIFQRKKKIGSVKTVDEKK